MPDDTSLEGQIIVTFVRIGQDRNIPELVLPAMSRGQLKETIHNFVSDRLDTSSFTIQLTGDFGFIDLGTHSGGSFLLRTQRNPEQQADH